MTKKNPYYLIEGVPLIDVIRAKHIDENIEHYKQLLNSWFLSPAKKLAESSTRDDKMAAFVLLLTFFEPHGDCLKSDKGSGKKFKAGLSSFLEYLDNKKIHSGKIDQNLLKDHLWTNARCGIFHALTPEGVTVDLYDIFNDIFTIFNDKLIVNVKHFVGYLTCYVNYYFSNMNDDQKKIFKIHYQKLVLKPAIDLINQNISKP